MTAVPVALPSPRYSLWQPAITTSRSIPSSLYPLPGSDKRDVASNLPATTRTLFPYPSHITPLPIHPIPPGMTPQCLRVPIPLHQLAQQSFHHHNRQIHHLGPTASITTTHPVKDRESSTMMGQQVSSSGTLIPRALPLPSDIRRPLPLIYNFTASDLDSALYGYVRTTQEPPCGMRCAMSGLRLHQSGRPTPAKALPPPGDEDVKVSKDDGGKERAHSVLDREKPVRKSLLDSRTVDLPEGISITQANVGGFPHYSVFCHASVIHKGARFGPFTGRIIHPSEIKSSDDTNFMWEIFQDGKLSHFVDGRNGGSNWLCFVNCARHAQEQNLTATQNGEYIYYEACKDIPKGTELLVWYGDSYRQFMGIPVSLKGIANTRNQTQSDEAHQDKEGYMCDRCGKVFSYKDYRDKHLKYTRCVDKGDRKFPCDLCTRSFEKKDRLRIHILHVHHKHRPHKCTVCGKSFSQSSSLNKHIRVHSGERPYKCVYCSKAFTASSILRTHIRQHSGEKPFKCKHCGKAFASHAAHDSHVRRTHAKDKPYVCPVCSKAFTQKYELKFHMNIHPEDIPAPYECETPNIGFANVGARDQHNVIREYSDGHTAV